VRTGKVAGKRGNFCGRLHMYRERQTFVSCAACSALRVHKARRHLIPRPLFGVHSRNRPLSSIRRASPSRTESGAGYPNMRVSERKDGKSADSRMPEKVPWRFGQCRFVQRARITDHCALSSAAVTASLSGCTGRACRATSAAAARASRRRQRRSPERAATKAERF